MQVIAGLRSVGFANYCKFSPLVKSKFPSRAGTKVRASGGLRCSQLQGSRPSDGRL